MLLEQMHCQLWNQFILFLNTKCYVLVLTMEFIINVKIADLNNNLFCDAPQECMTVLTATMHVKVVTTCRILAYTD